MLAFAHYAFPRFRLRRTAHCADTGYSALKGAPRWGRRCGGAEATGNPPGFRSNISISAPEATEEDIWRAAELAGIADDIRKMPMGMNTIIMEGSGTISGGQRQRIIIARAIVTQPDILFLDEATSALDNYTQKIVTDSLTSLHCTRVVIAHRLSTVRDCDRIIMIGNGGIVESGTYEELMEKDGEFAEMVRRQQI